MTVAIKVLQNSFKINKIGKREIKILETLNKRDPEGKQNIIRLISSFKYRSNIYLVFEHLSINLYDYMKETSFT